ncbi:MAG TPA: D-aminoacyl-tRNA deacylase, partial [bacterium]|nr:D-aminoacyl-tRNA deacylase [bacterium]
QVACGVFGAMMEIEAMNHGPVTIIIESPKSAGPDGG